MSAELASRAARMAQLARLTQLLATTPCACGATADLEDDGRAFCPGCRTCWTPGDRPRLLPEPPPTRYRKDIDS